MEETLLLEDSKIKEREKFLTAVYKSAFPIAAKYICKMGGSYDEAKDVFQDTLVLYYEKMVNGEDKGLINEKAYILALSKNLWINRYRDKSKQSSFDSILYHLIRESQKEEVVPGKLMGYLSTAGKRCMDLLSAFYFDKLPL